MITTTYKCDRCGHEQNSDNQMWTVAVSLHHGHHIASYSNETVYALWCRKCVENFCLLHGEDRPKQEDGKPKPPNIEDLIRAIVREEMEAHEPA